MAWDRTKPAELQLKPRLILIGSVRGNSAGESFYSLMLAIILSESLLVVLMYYR
jgi:hypothetical protein